MQCSLNHALLITCQWRILIQISTACQIGLNLNPIFLVLNLKDMPGINCIRALRKNVTLIRKIPGLHFHPLFSHFPSYPLYVPKGAGEKRNV